MTIIGPGDKVKIHDLDAELKAEAALGDEMPAVMMPPTVLQETHFLVLTVYEAAELPVLDAAIGLTKAGIDAFTEVEMGTSKVRSRVITKKGVRAALNPQFLERFWLPVVVPTMNNTIKLSVWDYDKLSGNDCVATTFFKFDEVVRLSPMGPMWVNLYGYVRAPGAWRSCLVPVCAADER